MAAARQGGATRAPKANIEPTVTLGHRIAPRQNNLHRHNDGVDCK